MLGVSWRMFNNICRICSLYLIYRIIQFQRNPYPKVPYWEAVFTSARGVRGKEANGDRPMESVLQPVVDFINQAKKSLDMCFYLITDYTIVDAVVAAKRRGVKVRIIVDYNSGFIGNEHARKFFEEGIRVFAQKSGPTGQSIMHNKFCIRDKKTLYFGSMNLTQNTSKGSFENIIITEEKKVVDAFMDLFNSMVENIEKSM